MYVYETICLINGKKYIGVKISKKNYKSYLGSGILLTRAIKKYGRDNFKKNILKYFTNEVEARDYERSLIKELNAIDDPNYYNLVAGGYGGGVKNHKHKQSTKDKISKTRKLNGCGPSRKLIESKMKVILQYDVDGNFIREFNSKKEAEEEVLSSPMSIKNNEVVYRGGFLWLYKNDIIIEKIDPYSNHIKNYIKSASKKSSKLNKEEILNLLDDKNSGMKYKDISKKYNISPGSISEIVNGKSYKWLFDDIL